jgi:hypothetical protein
MVVFALGLLEAGLIAAIVITASTAWAIGEALDVPRSVNASPRRAVYFYAPAVLCTAIAAGTLMLPHVPISFLSDGLHARSHAVPADAVERSRVGRRARQFAVAQCTVDWGDGPAGCNGLYGISTMFPNTL